MMTQQRLFPESEYHQRLHRVRRCMQQHRVDALIVDECELLHYFTGYAVTENMYRALLIGHDGDPCMVLRALDVAPYLAVSWCTQHHAFADTANPLEELRSVITANNWHRSTLAIDLNSYCMPAQRFAQLQSLLPSVTWVDFHDVLRPLRLCKSSAEVSVLARAARVADGAFEKVMATAKVGFSARDAAATAAAAFLTLGADNGRTGPITRARGWDFLHAALDDKPLVAGDVLHLELVPKVGGYCAKLMRAIVVGAPSKMLIEAADTLIRVQDEQIKAMVPGACARDVDAIVREQLLGCGLREHYHNNTGYTLGYIFEQGPRSSDFTRVFTAGANWRLQQDMVFHMYASAGGVAFSETVQVTPNGGKRLTQTQRQLHTVTLESQQERFEC